MRDTGLIHSELEHWRGIDTTYVITIQGVTLDEKIPKSNCTLQDFLAHYLVDIILAQKVQKYVVVGLIILRTEIMFHCDSKPHSIVQCGRSRKLSDLQYSRKIGNATRNAERYNWGCCTT